MSADVPPKMLAISPGLVSVSDRRTRRVWSVELQPYELAATPVTQAQYCAVYGAASQRARRRPLPGRVSVLVGRCPLL
jgi:hypothetical protein